MTHNFQFLKTINGEDWKRYEYYCNRCGLIVSHGTYLDQSDLDYAHNASEAYAACNPTDGDDDNEPTDDGDAEENALNDYIFDHRKPAFPPKD